MADPRQIFLEVTSELENIPLVGLFTSSLCTFLKFSDTEANLIELCVVEAVANSVKHAYAMEGGEKVSIRFTLYPEKMVCEVCDSGCPMKRDTFKNACNICLDADEADIDNIAEEGRGLPIMNAVMDELSYRSENGKNCLRLIKKRHTL